MGYIEFSLKTFLEKPEQQGWYKIKKTSENSGKRE